VKTNLILAKEAIQTFGNVTPDLLVAFVYLSPIPVAGYTHVFVAGMLVPFDAWCVPTQPWHPRTTSPQWSFGKNSWCSSHRNLVRT
jgi:hypothetical protein